MPTLRVLTIFVLASVMVLAANSVEPAGGPPEEVASAMVAELEAEGHRVLDGSGEAYAEFWFRNKSVEAQDSGEIDVSWSTVPHGTLIGVVRFPGEAEDRRGQRLAAGVYTLRFSYYPVDGAHQGVEPSRDFLILSPASDDTDPSATPDFETLMGWSRKASGTRHPAGLAVWNNEAADWEPGLTEMGEDLVLNTKVGDTQISVIVKGVNPHG